MQPCATGNQDSFRPICGRGAIGQPAGKGISALNLTAAIALPVAASNPACIFVHQIKQRFNTVAPNESRLEMNRSTDS
jgi:hypothetical protein